MCAEWPKFTLLEEKMWSLDGAQGPSPPGPRFGPGPLTFVSAVRLETRPCWKLALGLSVPDTSYSGCAGD